MRRESGAMCERLTAGKHTPERCLEAAIRFLLDREPKESIPERFDMTAISRYFPSSSGTFRSFDKGRCVYGKRSPHETAGR